MVLHLVATVWSTTMARCIMAHKPRTFAGLGFNPALPAVVRWQTELVQTRCQVRCMWFRGVRWTDQGPSGVSGPSALRNVKDINGVRVTRGGVCTPRLAYYDANVAPDKNVLTSLSY